LKINDEPSMWWVFAAQGRTAVLAVTRS